MHICVSSRLNTNVHVLVQGWGRCRAGLVHAPRPKGPPHTEPPASYLLCATESTESYPPYLYSISTLSLRALYPTLLYSNLSFLTVQCEGNCYPAVLYSTLSFRHGAPYPTTCLYPSLCTRSRGNTGRMMSIYIYIYIFIYIFIYLYIFIYIYI